MTEIKAVTTHVATGISRLLEQYQESEKFKILASIYLESVQEIENVNRDLYLKTQLPNSVGELLDFLGYLVGEYRNGRDDDLYRIWIAVRVRLNQSKGRADDIIDCIKIATDAAFTYREFDDAAFRVTFTEEPDYANDIALIIWYAKGAGIHATVWFPAEFRLCNVGGVSDPAKGLSDIVR